MKRRPGPGGVNPDVDYPDLPDGSIRIVPGDFHTYRYLGRADKDDFEVGGIYGDRPKIKDFLIVVAGADEGEMFAALFRCYPIAPLAVTKVIRPPSGRADC
jgi:hypothetical protein